MNLFCQAVLYKDPQRDHKCYEKLCVITLILFPLLFTWIPLVTEEYGPAGAWCWIQNWKNNCIDNVSITGVTEQFALWYGPAMLVSVVESIAIIVIVFWLLFCYQPLANDSQGTSAYLLEETQSAAQKRRKALKELLPLLAYPILFCVLLIPPLVNRIIGAANKSQEPNVTAILASGITVPLRSFFAGLTLFIHILVLKICFRRTGYVRLITYSNPWVFVGPVSTDNYEEIEASGIHHADADKILN